jgi:hypothetical protein
MGRKTSYTDEVADAILQLLEKGEPLQQICRREGFPAARTVYDWIDENPQFAASFAHARARGFDAIAADCLRIADESAGDVIQTENGPKQNPEFAARSKIRIETRLKLLAKWDPKRYGDKIQVEDTTPQKSLSRDETREILLKSGLKLSDIFDTLTKPAEPIPLEIEEKPQDTEDDELAGIVE